MMEASKKNEYNIKLYDLLTKGSHEEIERDLLNEIYKISTYCAVTIGEGSFGKVTIQPVGSIVSTIIDDTRVHLSVVVKESKHKGIINFDKINGKLIINSSDDMTCEALILFILSKSWYKGKNLHLPFLCGMGSCDDNRYNITHLVLEKCGLGRELILYDPSDFLGNPITVEHSKKLSLLPTVGWLFDYINININFDMTCNLPNGLTINVTELIDTLIISYIHTSHCLWEHYGLVLGDQHCDNVFIYWLDELSRCGTFSLSNIKTISYKIGKNKYLKINTYGFILKIGDCGISIMNINENVMIVGNLNNKNNINKILDFEKKRCVFWDFIINFYSLCPFLFKNTIIDQILEKHNIKLKYVGCLGIKQKYKEDIPNELEILNDELYKKYISTKNNETNETNFNVDI